MMGKCHVCTTEKTVLICIISELYELRGSLHQRCFNMRYFLDYLGFRDIKIEGYKFSYSFTEISSI